MKCVQNMTKLHHHLIHRGLYTSDDIDSLCSLIERGDDFYIYINYGYPSTCFYLGNTISFQLAKWLQDCYNVQVVVHISVDDSKSASKLAEAIIKDVIAFGFRKDITFIYHDLSYYATSSHFFQPLLEMQRHISIGMMKEANLQVDEASSLAEMSYDPSLAAVGAFSVSFPHLFATTDIPCLVLCHSGKEESIFRLFQNAAIKAGFKPPLLLVGQPLPLIQGAEGQLVSSDPSTSIFLSDSTKVVKSKVNKYAFSGGGATIEEHRANGGNVDVDISFQYLRYFLEDDLELAAIAKDYKSGELLTGFLKKRCIEVLQAFLSSHAATKLTLTDQDILPFTSFHYKEDVSFSHFVKVLLEERMSKMNVTSGMERVQIIQDSETKDIEDSPLPDDGKDNVTPWSVTSASDKGVDYNKLIDQFGSSRIDSALLDRMEAVIGQPVHPLLRRGIFFSHRDLDFILSLKEAGKSFYLYTGRGPSSSAMHCGHLIPFILTKWLQDVFDVPLVIQLTDDEKYLWKSLDFEEAQRLSFQNAKEIISVGFNPDKTFIFMDSIFHGGCQEFFQTALQFQRKVTVNKAKSVFGFTDESSIGQVAFPSVQASPSFSVAFPHIFGKQKRIACLIPCAIDQDPYFRLTRDIAPRLGYLKPALLHSVFFPALQGARKKMSSSDPTSNILLTDTADVIDEKIMKYASSGQGDVETDVCFQYLRFFMYDEEKLNYFSEAYSKGLMTSREIKEQLIKVLQDVVRNVQEERSKVTDELLLRFMVRPVEHRSNNSTLQ